MSPKLKPLDQQVIVITGASSGIGLATAQLAAQLASKQAGSFKGQDRREIRRGRCIARANPAGFTEKGRRPDADFCSDDS